MPRNSHDNSLYRFDRVKQLAKTYSLKPRYYGFVYENQSTHIKRNIRIIDRIDKALEELNEELKTIFRNTFFDIKDLYWWNTYYSKTTFYRLRNQAIKDFLLAYDNYEK
ncbi:MAG: hypothetical protein KBS97_01010 [Firmicutes bacterium]|nr:hypothetical protein [Candidatus Fiminaster equi]